MTVPTTTAFDPAILETAAELLLEALPKPTADYVREVAYVYNRIPLWALICGHVIAAYEQGTMTAPILDPSWPRRFDALVDLLAKGAVCEHCQQAFQPKRYKQRFCSQECGTAAEQAVTAAAG